ncbi:hypothetical protein DFR86_11455 [Acidianus sulfidivorans JP7]|nr:hypothetical protein [Acidianus sulfidivorans]AWR98089.2 hypothetical protein DFR86_11455 [Acidianus sulfidivorans JP7]
MDEEQKAISELLLTIMLITAYLEYAAGSAPRYSLERDKEDYEYLEDVISNMDAIIQELDKAINLLRKDPKELYENVTSIYQEFSDELANSIYSHIKEISKQ